MFDIRHIYRIQVLRLAAWLASRTDVPKTYSYGSVNEVRFNFTYFGISLDDANFDRFLSTKPPSSLGLIGKAFKDHAEDFENDWKQETACLPYKHESSFKYDIKRVYGTVSFDYKSPVSYIFSTILLIPRLYHYSEKRKQKSFEKNLRFTYQRMDILKKVVDWRRASASAIPRERVSREFSSQEALSVVFGIRIWTTKDAPYYLDEFTLVLESLTISGELRRVDHRFAVTGKSFETLSKFEEDNRRTRVSESNNSTIKWLTFMIALATAAQAVIAFYSSSISK